MITAIVLAAGKSHRYGSNKLHQELPNGELMAVQSIKNVKPFVDRIVCVVSAEDFILQQLFVDQGARVVINEEQALGLSNSLKIGVKHADKSDYWWIVLADMPYIQADSYQRLQHATHAELKKSDPSPIRPAYLDASQPLDQQQPVITAVTANAIDAQPGHPVAIPQRLKQSLLALSGDMGAKHIFQLSADVRLLPTHDQGVVWDIDQPNQLHMPNSRLNLVSR